MFSNWFQLQFEFEDDQYNCKMFFATTTYFFATIYPKKSTSWKQQTYVSTMDIDHFSCKSTYHYSCWKSFSTMIHVWMNFIYWCCMASFAYHYSRRSFSIYGISSLTLHDIIKYSCKSNCVATQLGKRSISN
jgi:hypothetical protein